MDTVRQLEYVAVSRATDTATVITDMAKVEDSPLNHEANQFSKADEHKSLVNHVGLLTLSRYSLKFSKWSEKSNISVIRRMRAILPWSVHCLKSCNISVDNRRLMSASKLGVKICLGIFHI